MYMYRDDKEWKYRILVGLLESQFEGSIRLRVVSVVLLVSENW